jgi:xanthine dehydrogenase large subunit
MSQHEAAMHRPSVHESAHLHVTGAARYVADLTGPPGTLWALAVRSPHARAVIRGIDVAAARAIPGVHAVLCAGDIPGHACWGPIRHDEPLLADGAVHAVGQAVAVVIADSEAIGRAGVAAVVVTYDVLEPILGIPAAIAAGSFLDDAPHVITRGDLDAAFAAAAHVIEGEVASPAQDHFYLETQAALVVPEEDGTWRVFSSTQHPTEIQRAVADTLGVGANRVVCEVPRLGGGFGGKESQATPFACMAALGAWVTGRACRMVPHRDEDMIATGKRHPFVSKWRAAVAADGAILGLDARLWADGGWSLDLSGPIVDRAMFHVDNACFLPAVRIEGRACRTNVTSNTAFRGFGGPQGMLVVDDVVRRIAEVTGTSEADVLRRNLYGDAPRDRTPYGQAVDPTRLPRVLDALDARSGRLVRVAEIAAFNERSRWVKRGLGLQAVKFGISFTNGLLNQAGATVLLYTDGTAQVNHGGTEMGQGLFTKMRAVAADALGIRPESVRVMATSTEKVPNTVATAASSGSDLNGAAVHDACATIVARLRPLAIELVGDDPVFSGGEVRGARGSMSVASLASAAWARRISLHATGFYATPGIAYDRAAGRGTPFFYYAFGAALVEVEVDGRTGESRLVRVDVVHDVGASLVPTIDRGQIEGAFVQGFGWLTMEDPRFDAAGRLITHGPSTYKIPASGDVPVAFYVDLLPDAEQPGVIGGSKAVGEPPFMLAIGVLGALRDAIRALRPGRSVRLALPATNENVLRAVAG